MKSTQKYLNFQKSEKGECLLL